MCDRCPESLCQSKGPMLYKSKYIHIHPPCNRDDTFEVHSKDHMFKTNFRYFHTCIDGCLQWPNLNLEDYLNLLKIKGDCNANTLR